MPLYRKQEIYQVCHDLNLIIIEDDAYYYLYYGDKYEQFHIASCGTSSVGGVDADADQDAGITVYDTPGMKGLPR